MLKWIVSALNCPVFSLALTAAFLVLNVLDGHSTYLVLKPNHFSRERNPIARWVFRKLKIPRASSSSKPS
ncbi:MAG: DUF5658 family protein [Candidatus Cloacimonas sp.]|nr:DUF5658 family protein [Candidatus Cloacimonas sp.]